MSSKEIIHVVGRCVGIAIVIVIVTLLGGVSIDKHLTLFVGGDACFGSSTCSCSCSCGG